VHLNSINNQNIDYIYGNLTAVSSSPGSQSTNTLNAVSTALNNIAAIPSVTPGQPLSLSYLIPLSASTTTSTIQSTFPNVLGTVSQPNSLIG